MTDQYGGVPDGYIEAQNMDGEGSINPGNPESEQQQYEQPLRRPVAAMSDEMVMQQPQHAQAVQQGQRPQPQRVQHPEGQQRQPYPQPPQYAEAAPELRQETWPVQPVPPPYPEERVPSYTQGHTLPVTEQACNHQEAQHYAPPQGQHPEQYSGQQLGHQPPAANPNLLSKGNLIMAIGGLMVVGVVGYGVVTTLFPNIARPHTQASSQVMMNRLQQTPPAPIQRASREAVRQPTRSSAGSQADTFSVNTILGSDNGREAPHAPANTKSIYSVSDAGTDVGNADQAPPSTAKAPKQPRAAEGGDKVSTRFVRGNVSVRAQQLNALIQEVEAMRREQKAFGDTLKTIAAADQALRAQMAILAKPQVTHKKAEPAAKKQDHAKPAKSAKALTKAAALKPEKVETKKAATEPVAHKAKPKVKYSASHHTTHEVFHAPPRPVYELAGAAKGVAWLRSVRTGKLREVHNGDYIKGYGTVLRIWTDGTIDTISGEVVLR